MFPREKVMPLNENRNWMNEGKKIINETFYLKWTKKRVLLAGTVTI